MDGPQFIWVHLNHPCQEIDVWYTTQPEEAKIAKRQGYVPLLELRDRYLDNEEEITTLEAANASLQHDINGKQGAILNYKYVVSHLETANADLLGALKAILLQLGNIDTTKGMHQAIRTSIEAIRKHKGEVK